MIDEVDKNIALDAFDDFQLVAHSVLEISKQYQMDRGVAWEEFQRRFNRLSQDMPLTFFVSGSFFGEMEAISHLRVGYEDVFDAEGNVAGPPYVYVHHSGEHSKKQFDAFFKRHGFPDWLKKKG